MVHGCEISCRESGYKFSSGVIDLHWLATRQLPYKTALRLTPPLMLNSPPPTTRVQRRRPGLWLTLGPRPKSLFSKQNIFPKEGKKSRTQLDSGPCCPIWYFGCHLTWISAWNTPFVRQRIMESLFLRAFSCSWPAIAFMFLSTETSDWLKATQLTSTKGKM